MSNQSVPIRVARRALAAWRGRKPGWATIENERFLLRYPYSYFDPGSEAPVLDAFSARVHAGNVVFDIGANAGIYALLAARRGADVVAFEPARAAAALLREHLRLNGLDATVEETVVTDAEGDVVFYEQGSATTSSLSEASARTGEEFEHDPVVRTVHPGTTIDAYCRRHGRWPHLVKIDVEGAEARVIAGASELLARRSATLLLEVHPWSLEQLGDSPDDVFAPLEAAGWRSALIEDNGNTQHYLVEPDPAHS